MSFAISAFQKATLALFLGLFLFLPLVGAQAATTSGTVDRAALLAQIQLLQAEIKRLQTIRATEGAPEGLTKIYQSKFFTFDFDAVYTVTPTGLVRIDDPKKGVRATDARLYKLFSDIVGKEQAYRYIEDFRVYNYPDADTSAFVETMSGSDKWLMGVNTSESDSRDRAVRASFIDLFLHEYAHLLFLEEKELVEDFKTKFWTKADMRHAAQVKDSTRRFDYLESYFEDNTNRFISDYATLNSNEDMAESFVEFVMKGKPSGGDVVDDKVRYFYTSPEFVNERTRLRQNLQALNAGLSGT